jgi:hypothetical protein
MRRVATYASTALDSDGQTVCKIVLSDEYMRRNGAVVNQIKSNPGLWMARCHIAERLRSGVMFSFSEARDWEQAR